MKHKVRQQNENDDNHKDDSNNTITAEKRNDNDDINSNKNIGCASLVFQQSENNIK